MSAVYETTAWKRGYRDGQSQVPAIQCPYVGHKAKEWHDGWEAGWNDGVEGRNALAREKQEKPE